MVGPLCHQSGSFCIYPELDLCPVLLPPANWDVCGEFHGSEPAADKRKC